MTERSETGAPLFGDRLLVLMNAYWENVTFALPEGDWTCIVDTETFPRAAGRVTERSLVGQRSLQVLVPQLVMTNGP